MGEFQLSAHLAQLNAVHREMDEVYHQTAKALGFSDGAFWILYAVREADGQLTQRELCDRMFMPKQTVNSALKKMEREGVLELRPAENRRGKRVFLGEKGRSLAERTVDALFAAETRALVKKLLTGFSGSAVLDADGLNAAASLMNAGEKLPRPAKGLILTPHPGEMSRLTGLSVEAIQADREGVARRYAAQWNAVVVLKGARTVVAAPDGRVCVNPTGNPGLARGGSGDVLAGMMSALLACGLSAYEAAACAVWLHGAAADRAARQKGEYGMLPQDIFAHLGQMFAENDR